MGGLGGAGPAGGLRDSGRRGDRRDALRAVQRGQPRAALGSGTGAAVSRRTVAWIALAAVVVVTLAIVAWPSGGKLSQAARVRSVSSELRCPDCESQSIAQSSTETARAARADIRTRVAAGQSDAEIRQAYIDKFGPSILLKPESGGVGGLAWGPPAPAPLPRAGGLVLALRRWRREPHLRPTDADRELVQRARPR